LVALAIIILYRDTKYRRKMNTFKKIGAVVATVVALGALSTLPANAAVSTTLTVGGSAAATTGATSATAIALPVPADNSVDSADALKIAVTGLDTGTTVSAVASNATIVPALATVTAPVTAASGSTSLSVSTGTGTTAEFYVYTKTTAVGSVSVTIAGNTTVYYVQGTAGALNSITLIAPATAAAGTTQKITVAGYDVFGNAKSGATINTLVTKDGAATATALTTDTVTATIGTKTQDIILPASGSVSITAYATVASLVTGLSAPVGSVVATITVRDLVGELATVTAQLAAEKAGRAADKVAADKALADAIAKAATDKTTAQATADAATATAAASYKAEYNALATKWNKAHPKAKVALKK
jgi:hypothetical protein